MWSIFGLVYTLLGTLYILRRKMRASWKGDAGKLGSVDYRYEEVRNRSADLVGIRIGIESAVTSHFGIKREKGFDRLAKRLGLSTEFHTGNEAFDEHFYIVSDDPRLLSCLNGDTPIHANIQKLFELNGQYGVELQGILGAGNRLWLEFKSDGSFHRGLKTSIAELAVPTLTKLAADLANESIGQTRTFDRYAVRAALLLALSAALFTNAVFQFFRSRISLLPFTLDTGQLWFHSLLVGGAVVALLMAVTIAMLGRTSRAHLVLAEIVLIGSLGAWGTAMQELNDLNRELDPEPARSHVIKVQGKLKEKSRKSTKYMLYVADWRKPGAPSVTLNVPSYLYEAVGRGDYIALYQRPGYLGYAWVEGIDAMGREPTWSR
jgi:hypothetical protein